MANVEPVAQILIEKIRNGGVSDKTILALASPDSNVVLEEIAEAMIRAIGRTKSSLAHCPNNTHRRLYELYENRPRRITSLRSFKPLPVVKQGRDRVDGEYLVWHARIEGADYSQEDAEFLLTHQDEIPIMFEKFILVFPGTQWLYKECIPSGHPWDLYRHLRDALHIPYLHCDKNKRGGRRWTLNFENLSGLWLDDGHNPGTRLVCPEK